MEGQLALPHRAYLSVGDPEEPEGNQVSFPIENTGRVPGRITHLSAEVIFSTGDAVYQRDIGKIANETIAPANYGSFRLSVLLPEQANRADDLVIHGNIKYDTGFKSIDTLDFTRVYVRRRSEWVTAWSSVKIDFTTYPGNKGQQNS